MNGLELDLFGYLSSWRNEKRPSDIKRCIINRKKLYCNFTLGVIFSLNSIIATSFSFVKSMKG